MHETNLETNNATPPPLSEFDPSCTRNDLLACFRLLLGRNPGIEEWKGHAWRVGMPLIDVVRGFLGSTEFKDCAITSVDLEAARLAEYDTFSIYALASDLEVGAHVLAQSYERTVFRRIRDRLREGSVFVDIGANIGLFSMLAASRVGPTGKVFSIEPSADNVRMLHASTALNQFHNITILPIAVGEIRQPLFYDNSNSNGRVADIQASNPKALLGRTYVYCMPMDELLANEERIDVVKIDVEGFELRALAGAKEILRKHHPTIFTEYSPSAMEVNSRASGRDYLEFLSGFGYGFHILDNEIQEDAVHLRETKDLQSLSVNDVLEQFQLRAVDHLDLECTSNLAPRP